MIFFAAGFFLFLLLAMLIIGVALLFGRREREWIEREEKWRSREMALVDKLLKQAHIPPVEIQRENVVKLPDPDIQPASFIDDAFFQDDVKELLEQSYPEAARMSHSEAQQRYAKDWARISRKLKEESTPLRAQ